MRRTKRRQHLPLQALFLAVVLGIAGYFLWANAATTNPAEALARAVKEIKAGQNKEAEMLLSLAEKTESLRPWAALLRSRLLESQGQFEKAFKSYASVSAASAPSLDARLGIFRLKEFVSPSLSSQHVPPVTLASFIAKLERDIRNTNRGDLREELLYLQAREAEQNHNAEKSFQLYHQIRVNFPSSPKAKHAREAESRLFEIYPERVAPGPAPSMLEEANLLLFEGQPELALKQIQALKTIVGESSPIYFEALLIEEQILRKQKHREEADRLLLTIGTHGGINTADRALLKTAKNAWNVDDHHRALEFLDMLQTRFPNSPLDEDARYIEARILEEMSHFGESKDLYISLSNTTSDLPRRVKALRHIAWLSFREGDFPKAADYFNKMGATAREFFIKRQVEQSSTDLKKNERELREEEQHALFWEAFCKAEQGSQHHPLQKNDLTVSSKKDAISLWQKLATRLPQSYYTMKARQHLNKLNLGNNATSSHPFPTLTPSAHTGNSPSLSYTNIISEAGFGIHVPNSVMEMLRTLHQVELLDFSQHEIDWYFREHETLQNILHPHRLSENTKTNSAPEKLRPLLEKAALSLDYGHPRRGIELAEKISSYLNNLSEKTSGADKAEEGSQKALREAIAALSFPTPWAGLFHQASKEQGLSLPLLLAVARTESFFDPLARSRTDALGILQLMQNTAKQEGLKEGEDLLDPQVNIRLGAKHLGRLFLEYESELAYTIAAYNAGTSVVNRWRNRHPTLSPEVWVEFIGYPETYRYVKEVLFTMDVYGRG